jgi:hypothetical protein
MQQFDRKNRGFYDDLTDEERKKFSNYLMIRWGSAVRGSRELQEFYVIATNERLNRHFFSVNRHPRLQWLMATAVSPDLGAQDHVWIAPKKKETGSNEVRKILLDLYPAMKISDIETLAALVDRKSLKEHLREHGNPD